jgi:hypothetical protein
MSSSEQVWWRPEGRSPFALDPDKPFWPQIISIVWQSLIIFGGPVIGLVTINYYPFLIQDRTIYIGGLASVVFWFWRASPSMATTTFPAGCRNSLN